MKKNKTKMNNKGFSLVELIVVIAIMAVLVGVLAPQFIKYVERSRQSTDIQNIEEVANALQVYFADNESGTGTHEVILSTTGATADPTTDTEVDNALTNAGIKDSAKLKSSGWGQTASGGGDGVRISLDLSTGAVTKTGKNTYFNADGTRVP